MQPERLRKDTPQDDLADIRDTLEGREEAFARLVRRHEQVIGAQMWRFTRDPGEQAELVQDVFVEAYRSLPGFRDDAPFLHWLRRIATRTGYRYWKARDTERRSRDALEERARECALTEIDPSPPEAAEALHELLATLPAADRLVLSLHYFEDLSMQEIADRTGWNRTLVKVRAFRARRKLRGRLEAAGFGRTADVEQATGSGGSPG